MNDDTKSKIEKSCVAIGEGIGTVLGALLSSAAVAAIVVMEGKIADKVNKKKEPKVDEDNAAVS